jgi:PAS domain S-box-containing protein
MKRMKAAERNALLAAIVESSDDAIVSKSLDGTVRSWNHAAERMFGYTAAEAIGRNITLIIPADRLSEENEILTKIRSGQKIDHFVTVRQAKDGSLLNISLTVSPIRDASGAIIGASKVARDISGRISQEREREEKARLLESEMTIRRGIEEELHQKVADLVEADKRKDEFLAMLGHELRNPLSAVSNSIAVACLDAERRERALDIARRETAQLTR